MVDAELSLTAWFHPSMQIPFKLDMATNPFKVKASTPIVDLMDLCEDFFEAKSKTDSMMPMMLQINVLWNTKDHKKALNPSEKVGDHFKDGESFGVYGDIAPATANEPSKAEEEKTPVTILTGFLGSGKTTLLNYILQEQRDRKIAIIENEFGEISIDDALLKQSKMDMAEKIVVMDNGCMCCTIRGDLVNGLKEILADIHKGGKIDCIMIETTGMADPVPIVRTFMTSPELTSELRLDAVITMTDAKHLIGRLDDTIEEGKVNEAHQQVAFADKIILNKLDLITPEEAIKVKDRIRSVNKFAKILPAVKGRVRMEELCNIHAHDMGALANTNFEEEAAVAEELSPAGHGGHGGHEGHGGHGGHGDGHGDDCGEEHGQGGHGGHGEHEGHGGHSGHGGGHSVAAGHGHGNGSTENRHDNRVNSFAIVREGEIGREKLGKWMKAIGTLPPERGIIFRIKAILAVRDHPFKHVFHAVMDASDEDDAGPWAEGEKKVCKIVFIGKSMDQAFLRAGWEDIFQD